MYQVVMAHPQKFEQLKEIPCNSYLLKVSIAIKKKGKVLSFIVKTGDKKCSLKIALCSEMSVLFSLISKILQGSKTQLTTEGTKAHSSKTS